MEVKVSTSCVLSAKPVSEALSERLERKLSAEYETSERYCRVLARALNVRVWARPNILARESSRMPRGLAAISVAVGSQAGVFFVAWLQLAAIRCTSNPNP